jgi:hypothetical protein
MGITNFDAFDISINSIKILLVEVTTVVAIQFMEIKDNAFSRQFETTTAQGLVTVEYLSRKKIFSPKYTLQMATRRIPY